MGTGDERDSEQWTRLTGDCGDGKGGRKSEGYWIGVTGSEGVG